MRTTIALMVTGFLLAGANRPALAQSPPVTTTLGTDPDIPGDTVVTLLRLRPGSRVADVFGGRMLVLFARAVAPSGKVYAVEPTEITRFHPEMLSDAQRLAQRPDSRNVVTLTDPIDKLAFPAGLDAVFIRQNYHDLHDKFMGPADVPAFNRKIFAALKPGGFYVIVDHMAAAGSGLRDTETLHRIDPAAVRAEVTAAGFIDRGGFDAVGNDRDTLDKVVFDPVVRGHTKQFVQVYEKPGAPITRQR